RRMLAAIMPSEHPLCHATRPREGQNTLVVTWTLNASKLLVLVPRILATGIDHFKEICRRQLLVVSDNNHLFGSRNGTQCIFWRDLAGFVDDKEIKRNLSRRQKLSDRKRTHEEHRLEALNCISGLDHQLASRKVPSLALYLAANNAHFADIS